jgi:hypothetical protein
MGSWDIDTHTGGRPATWFVLADSPDRPLSEIPISQNSNGKSGFRYRNASKANFETVGDRVTE